MTQFFFSRVWSCEYHEVLYWNIIHFQSKTLRCSQHFKVDSAVVVSIFTVWCSHPSSLVSKCRLAVILISPRSSTTETTDTFSAYEFACFGTFHINGIVQYHVLGARVLSTTIMLSRLIHGVACVNNPFLHNG